MVLKKVRADLEGWGKLKTLIREALPSEFLKKKKTVYITNGASGDLLTYVDPAMPSGQKVTYSYNQTHGLISIKDPTGNLPVRTDYDSQGRMVDTKDAKGNEITYTYNLAANSEAVTNAKSQPTSYLYDNNGNILQKTQYLNGSPVVTSYTYSTDGYNNKLTELLSGNSQPTVYQYGDTNNPTLPTKVTDPNGNSTLYTYDGQGHILTTIDPRTITTTNTYDGHGNLSTSQVQGFPASSYSYDANGNVLQETDPAGVITNNTYDPSGNLLTTSTSFNGQVLQTTTYTYDSNGNKKTQTKTSGAGTLTTIYSYDAKNRLQETIYPDGTNSQTTYDSMGHVVGTQDQKGRDTSTFYYATGQAATILYPDTRKIVYVYDANGNKTDITEYGTDGTSRNTHTDYDGLNHPATITYPDGGRSILVYDGQGRTVDTIDENGNDTHSGYDQAGRNTIQITANGTALAQETDYGYDANGNQTSVQVAGQLQSTTYYDNLNRAATISYPQPIGQAAVGNSIAQYDADGNKTGMIDQAGKVTNYTPDGLGRTTQVTQVTSAGNINTAYTFDQVGNELTQMDANTHSTLYTWNNMNRRTKRQLPDGRSESYTNFDATGHLTNKTDFAGNQFTYGYTPLDDLLTSVSGGGVNLITNYDSFLRRQSMNDPTGQTTFNYDERDRMVKQTSPTGWGSLTFTYLPGSQVNTVQSSNTNGNNLMYEYDSLNRPATLLDMAKTTTINYDQLGNMASEVMPNAVTMAYTVDSLNRLTGITIVGGSGVLGGYQYTLGPTGNRTGESEYTGRQAAWGPDDLYRLLSETITNDPASNNGSIGYAYDPMGNRNQRTSSVVAIPTQTFTGGYDTADQLKPTFSFDQNGNQTSDSQNRTYTYNALNQLTHVTGTGLDVSYLYDGDGLRVQKTNNITGVTTNYLWDRNNLTGYPQVSEELQNGQVVRRYVYGLKGPLYQVQNTGVSWVTNYYGMDAQDVRLLMNDAGQVTDQYSWDAFGNLLSSTGVGTPNNMGAFGEYADNDTGLIYLRARWYNPALGRFMGMDSYEGDPENPLTLNKYAGFANDPTDKTDPGGNDFDIGSLMMTTAITGVLSALPSVTWGAGGVDYPIDLPVGKDCQWLSTLIYAATGRNTPGLEERGAIGWCVINRDYYGPRNNYHGWGPTIEETIKARGQFDEYQGTQWYQIFDKSNTLLSLSQIKENIPNTDDRKHFNDSVDAANLLLGSGLDHSGPLDTLTADQGKPGIPIGFHGHKVGGGWPTVPTDWTYIGRLGQTKFYAWKKKVH